MYIGTRKNNTRTQMIADYRDLKYKKVEVWDDQDEDIKCHF